MGKLVTLTARILRAVLRANRERSFGVAVRLILRGLPRKAQGSIWKMVVFLAAKNGQAFPRSVTEMRVVRIANVLA